MSAQFSRQLGRYQPGIQLNPLEEIGAGMSISIPDQTIAIAARLTRGRIDRPFVVDSTNFTLKCGKGESIQKNVLNEAYSHMYEAVNKGAYSLVVSRMHTESAALSWVIVTLDGSGNPVYEVASDLPSTPYMLAIKHHGCHNDGIQVVIHAYEKLENSVAVDTDLVNLRIMDADSEVLYEVSGSLNPDSMNGYNESDFIGNLVSQRTDEVEVLGGAAQAIPTSSDCYGRDANGYTKLSESELLIYFDEGGTGYALADYARAKTALRYTEHDYTYISVGGSESAAHITEMKQLAYDTNTQLRIDVPGRFTPAEAINFINQFNLDEHLVSGIYWAPLKSDDPLGLNGKFFMGTATRNMAYACGRNAVKNAKGYARKHYAIAMKEYPIDRNGIIQTYYPTDTELDQLAEAKITPVIYQRFEGGGSYCYTDSLTSAKTLEGYKKLNAVVDMSTDLDDSVVRMGRELLQYPIDVAIKRMETFLRTRLEGAQAAGWLIPSEFLNGAAFTYSIARKANRVDCMDVRFSCRYQGTVRQIEFSQTIVR